jgi:cyclic pyranopterin phosphate synthase
MTDDPFTHVDAEGEVQMVDVSAKPDVLRQATATGHISLRPETVGAIDDAAVAKGAVLPTARIAAIQAVKHTWSSIPLCPDPHLRCGRRGGADIRWHRDHGHRQDARSDRV